MAWHDFQPGEQYPLAKVVADCERRIRDSGVVSAEQKQGMVDLMQQHAPETVVWSPSGAGWGASPFNPNCWRTAEGSAVIPDGVHIPYLPEDGAA